MTPKRQLRRGGADAGVAAPLSAWRFVLIFGLVSLFTDMVYEGARSIVGPYLATLGASAAVIGVVAGAGDFMGYGLRVASGYLVSRSRHYWTWTIVGYALTVLSVPLIGASQALLPALLLYGTERLGKAVRSPAKDTLLSHASTRTGRGTAFGVHQAMDQFGAMAGPLILAAVLAAGEGSYRLAFGVLAVPGVVVLGLLAWLRARVPDPGRYERPSVAEPTNGGEAMGGEAMVGEAMVGEATPGELTAAGSDAPLGRADARTPRRLPGLLWQYVGAVGVLSVGVAPFPLLAVHAEGRGLLSTAQVPVLFALAMAVDGVTGPIVGRAYDRVGPVVLVVVPVAAGFAAFSFAGSAILVWTGVAVWGLVNGVLDSVVKAVVTQLVGPDLRAAAFGWLALVRGIGLFAAGVALGVAYGHGAATAVMLVLAVNVVGLLALVSVLRALPARQPA